MGKKSVHERVTELLPWFVNESLSTREREVVQVHLAECPQCRIERDRLQAISQMIREEDGVVPDYRFALGKVMSRINAAERDRDSARLAPRASLAASHGTRWKAMAGLGASLVGVVMLVAALGPGQAMNAEFQTLSTSSTPVGLPARRIALTFDQPIKAATIRQALIETQSNIISGPDDTGTYLIEVRLPTDISESNYIESIRAIDGVKMALYEE